MFRRITLELNAARQLQETGDAVGDNPRGRRTFSNKKKHSRRNSETTLALLGDLVPCRRGSNVEHSTMFDVVEEIVTE